MPGLIWLSEDRSGQDVNTSESFVEQMRAEAGGLTGAPKGEGESVQCGGRGRGLGLQGGLREEGSCKAIF